MKYLLPLLILIYCHEIKGVLEWTVVEKVTDYGQNVTLFCHVPNCCPKDAGWDRWTPNQRTLFIDVKTGRSNKKYDGKVEKDGYTLVIQNLTKNDLNVSYSCLYGVTLGEEKYLHAEDVFSYMSTTQPNVNNKISEGQVAGIIVRVIVIVAVALSVGLLVFHFHTKKKGTTEEYTYESVSQTDKDVTDIHTNEATEQFNDKEIQSLKKVETDIKTNEAAVQLKEKDCFLQNPTDVECKEGYDAILKCKVKSGSTHVKWSKDGKEMVQNEICMISNVTSKEKSELQLTLKKTKPSDSGEYIVEVGMFSRKLLLNVKEIPTEDEKRRYMEYLKHRKAKREYVRIQVIGKDRVGKTSIVRRLLGKGIYDGTSTDEIDFDEACLIRKSDGEWIVDVGETDIENIGRWILQAMDKKREGSEPSSEPQGLFYGQQQDKNENQTLTTDENKLLQDEGKKETLTPADENKPLPAEVKNSLASDENKLLPADKKKELLSNVQTDIKETSASYMIPRKNDTEIESINSCSGASHNNPNDNKSHVRESPKAEKHAHLHTDDQITDAIIDHMDDILLAGKIKKDNSEDLVECGIWDFAGRKDYYVAQTFFIQKAIYILVADIRETIGPIQYDENFKSDSSGENIDFWLDCVHCIRDDINESRVKELRPSVIVVVTGIDQVTDEEEVTKEYTKRFCNTFGNLDKVLHKKGQIHFISNTQSHEDVFKDLRNHISKIAQEMQYFAETLPSRWVELENALAVLKQLRKKGNLGYFEKWENIVKIGQRIDMEKDDLIHFLNHQHKIGNIIFFEDKRDYIILEPSWLVACFRCLVCDDYKKHCSVDELYKLKCSGELSDLLIDDLFRKVPELMFQQYKQHILNVMEKFDIIVKPKSLNSYYMPCMIKTSSTLKDIQEAFSVQDSNCTPWLVLEFKFLPIAYANSILFNYIKTNAVCKERSETRNGRPSIFAGKAVVYLDETKSSKLAICFSRNAISLQIWKYNNKDAKDDTKIEIINNLCNTIEELETKLNHQLQYNIKSKCSSGDYRSSDGRISIAELTKQDKTYFCEEHQTHHNKKDIADTWLKHAAAIEKNKQTNREKKVDADKEDMKKREGKNSQDIKPKSPKKKRENDVQLPWLVDADEFESMLLDGDFKSYENRLSLGGPCKAGKSTLASVLIGEEIQKNWESTDGLVIYFGRNGIDLEKKKMVPLKESEHGECGRKDLAKIIRGNPQVPKRYAQVNKKQKSTTTDRTVTATPVKHFISESPAEDAQKLTKNTTPSTHQFVTQPQDSITKSVNDHKGQPITIMEHKQTTQIQIFDIKDLQIQSDILNEVRNGKYKIEIAPSDLIDFGGQKSFDMTHQLFIQHSGSFLLMFDGRVGLNGQLDEYPVGVNAKSILKHWVESILTYSEDTDDIMPKIMFAATHRDLCKKTEMMKECFIRDIKDMFPDHPKNAHLHLDTVYFINGVDKNDPEIQRLTDQVVQFAMEQPSWGQRRPMQWVPLELQLSNMRMQNINIITKEVLQNVNKLNNDLSLNESQLNDFLLVQHSLGKLMYYSFTGLDNFIIIHPPALVNILRSFVTDEKFFPKDKKNKSILQQLSETGKISKRDLLSLWQQDSLRQYMANDAIKEFVVQLLIHLDILIVPKTVKTDSVLTDEYLVPCMIKGIRPSNFLSLKSLEGRTISLRYSLTRQSIPTALAYKIIGATINAWPLQYDDQKKLCLYHKAAIVNVSECNELRVFIEDNRVMVYLTNKESIISISPDIAASIQECLTKNFEMAILFHYKSCGTNINQNKVSEKYTIEVGYPCVSEACYKSSNGVGKIQSWTCPNSKKIEHQSKYLMYWTFDKKQKECGEQCEGLTEQELKAEPSEKHLVRLAKRINVKSIETLLSNLGVETNEWVMIKNDYDSHSITDKVYIALTRWKNSKISPKSTLKDLSDAMRDVDPKNHYICQVFRETVEELDFASINSKDFPGDDLLEGLSTHIGNCPMQLGIELGLSLADFDNMLFCRKDLPGLIKDILLEWRKRSNDKTIHSLVIALQQVNSGGIRYLQMK